MTPRVARRVLLSAGLLLVPMPMVSFGAWVPVARYGLLGAVCIGMRVAEGPGGVVGSLTGLFLGHALVYGLALWVGAAVLGQALSRVAATTRSAVVLLVVATALVWALGTEPYVTPFGTAARTNLVGVLR